MSLATNAAPVLLLFVAMAAVGSVQANGDSEDIPKIPIVNRTIEKIVLAESRLAGNVEIDFFRNNAYNCGLTGQYTFMVINPPGSGDQDEAPLWVYMHGGGSGYWDDDGKYFALNSQTEDTWNHEETFDDLVLTLSLRGVVTGGGARDNTLTRRLKEGYRMLVVAMCDHDQYLGMGTPYPNNPSDPDAEVNGLQASLAAIDFTAAKYPTTHVFVHGTSAGSLGAYAVGLSYAAEGVALTGVISDSVLGLRASFIQAQLAGTPGFPQQAGFDQAAISAKVGDWRDEAFRLDPESRFAAGFDGTPILQIGGMVDPQCAGNRNPLPEASADGFENNCAWVAQPLKDLIQGMDAESGTLHAVVLFEGEGHVPTTKPGAAHDVVDAFIDRTISKETSLPFASPPAPTTTLATPPPVGEPAPGVTLTEPPTASTAGPTAPTDGPGSSSSSSAPSVSLTLLVANATFCALICGYRGSRLI